jgi:hypothetical protein
LALLACPLKYPFADVYREEWRMHASLDLSRPDPKSLAEKHRQAGAHRCRLVHLLVERTIQLAFGIIPEVLNWPSRRSRPVMFARHVAIYLAKTVGALTLTDAAGPYGLGRRAAGYAVAQIEARREQDPAFDSQIGDLCDQVHRQLAGLQLAAVPSLDREASATPTRTP